EKTVTYRAEENPGDHWQPDGAGVTQLSHPWMFSREEAPAISSHRLKPQRLGASIRPSIF
ncbi:mCG142513, isoform CRA_b, partial [Mus musculus]